MPPEPWEEWGPGVLNTDQVNQLITNGNLINIDESSIGASSFDLHLGAEGFQLLRGSIKPFGSKFQTFLENPTFAKRIKPCSQEFYTLCAGNTYVFKLKESLSKLNGSQIYGQATAKSSVGRVDVLARLIVDGADRYESFSYKHLGTGELFLEITPITFNVRVHEGKPLSQLRLFYRKPEESEIPKEEYQDSIVQSKAFDGYLSVDITETEINNITASAFKACVNTCIPVDLWKKETAYKPDPCDYWEVEKQQDNRLTIRKGSFYILRSIEKFSLPSNIAVYCQATDESIGEMRIHYAGFVHPYFGKNTDPNYPGTPLIFEVRGHCADVNLRNGEKLAHIIAYRMSKEAAEDPSDYEGQTLKLSSFFTDFPENIQLSEGGRIAPMG